MITLERYSPLAREMSGAENRQSILNAMRKLPEAFGLRHFSLFHLPTCPDELVETLVVESSHPMAFFRDLDRKRILSLCPIVPLLKNMALPLCCSYSETDAALQNLVMPRPVVEFFLSYNIRTSVIIPCHSREGTMFLMRLDGDRSLLTLPELNELGMLALQAFTMFDRIQHDESAGRTTLTRRELEVLRWTAQGKTSSEIAGILSLSDHTVNAYLNKAIRKLNCVNRTQLVATALRLRLIS